MSRRNPPVYSADEVMRHGSFDEWERLEFADPGGSSALRAGTRNLPCPTCKEPNRLTAKDRSLGYQCDACADRDEGGGY